MSKSKLEYCVNFSYGSDYIGSRHAHPCYELVYYVTGNGIISFSGDSFVFEQNTFSLTKPNEYHIEKGSKGTEVLYIGFSLVDDSLSLLNGLYYDKEKEIIPILKLIDDEFKTKLPNREEVINSLTDVVIYRLMRKTHFVDEDREEGLKFVKDYIQMNFMRDITVKSLAKLIGYNYDYFRHIFQDEFGIAVKEYVINKRIEYSKDLLIRTDYSINEIANMSGFKSPAHFAKTFKVQNNKTPSQFRSKLNKKGNNSEIILLDNQEILFVDIKEKIK